jgi:uncharacterized protein
MDFAWSEAKRIAVLEARGLDFIDAEILFDGPRSIGVASPRGAAERWLSVGELNGRLVAVVWTQRSDTIRIITMRRARNEEKAAIRCGIRLNSSVPCASAARVAPIGRRSTL